jgi:hypothetical protein
MFAFGNIDVEFLEPGPRRAPGATSLEEKGPGCHHIAFRTRNLSKRHTTGREGPPAAPAREFDGSHGRYAYYDTVTTWGDDRASGVQQGHGAPGDAAGRQMTYPCRLPALLVAQLPALEAQLPS